MPVMLPLVIVMMMVLLHAPASQGLVSSRLSDRAATRSALSPSGSSLSGLGSLSLHKYTDSATGLVRKTSSVLPLSSSFALSSADLPISGDSSLAVIPPIDPLTLPVQPGPHLKVKGKVLNFWGVFFALSVFVLAAAVLPIMGLVTVISDFILRDGKRRRLLDWFVHFWAWASMELFFFSGAKIYGLENLPPASEPVVYVPNHTSFLDILMLSGFVPRPFKYLSKSEILDIPLVGWGMKLAKHVFLKRNDIKSTIECSETVVQRLQDGNSIVLFAEGTRSLDGKLKTFKKGAFQMAKSAGVRIVPVSIGNLHRVMPPSCALPVAPVRYPI